MTSAALRPALAEQARWPPRQTGRVLTARPDHGRGAAPALTATLDDMEGWLVDGAGNRFVLLEEGQASASWLDPNAAVLCESHRVDGVLLVERSDAPSMRVWNRDGTQAEMCGNGLRCVAAHVARATDRRRFDVETAAGPLACQVLAMDASSASVRVEIGTARALGLAHPEAAAGRPFHGVDVGNPHAIHFVDSAEDPGALARALGPQIEHDPAYAPRGTNVEFARIDGERSITLHVWERGVGITAACGTGAAATAFAALHAGHSRAEGPVEVALPGGRLVVEIDSAGVASLTGPCRVLGRVELYP